MFHHEPRQLRRDSSVEPAVLRNVRDQREDVNDPRDTALAEAEFHTLESFDAFGNALHRLCKGELGAMYADINRLRDAPEKPGGEYNAEVVSLLADTRAAPWQAEKRRIFCSRGPSVRDNPKLAAALARRVDRKLQPPEL